MDALLLTAAIVVPCALVGWLALTWPADAAADRLWRRSDEAWDRGEIDTAQRYRRVADGLADHRGLYRSAAVLSMGRIRDQARRTGAVTAADLDDPVTRDAATLWLHSSIALIVFSVAALLVDAVHHPRLVARPGEWRARSTARRIELFAAHDAAVVEHGAALAAMREQLAAHR